MPVRISSETTLMVSGQVPAFKNHKRAILDRKTGKLRTLTEPKVKKWMAQCESDLLSQLRSLYLMTAAETPMGVSAQSWIASVAPSDDSVKEIPEIHVNVEKVPKGKEGAEIKLRLL